MTENKQAICDALCTALQLTRGFHDLVAIEYDGTPYHETATLIYEHGKGAPINVALDSGEAMIRDIMRWTGGGR